MRPLPGSDIPDGEILFRYCNPGAFPEGQVEIPGSLFNYPELSCDWERLRPDPTTSFHLAEGKTRVIAITVCDAIRNPRNPKRGNLEPSWRQEIIYAPVSDDDDALHGANEAHSLIRGKKKMAVRDALVAHSVWRDL